MRPPAADERRSELMRRVRQRRTQPEERVAVALRRAGVRYRRNVRDLDGSPDFASKSRRWAIFVHGCFWHRHPDCHRTTTPKHNREFWQTKFQANVERDSRKLDALARVGFKTLVIWECESKNPDQLDAMLSDFFEPGGIEGR